MRVAFLVGDVAGISGGSNVIIEYAHGLAGLGHEVALVVPAEKPETAAWHPKLHKLKLLTFAEAAPLSFDFAFATWWTTFFDLWRIEAKIYGYLNQSYESRFHAEEHYKLLNRLTYSLPLFFFTEAVWLEQLIQAAQPGARVLRLSNGLSREHFPVVAQVPPRKGPLRVLVEGPWGVPFKAVAETFQLLARARERFAFDAGWLTSWSGFERPHFAGKPVQMVHLHEAIPISQVAQVLGNYDVMVKLSRVEGVFGPPLEMFSQGGTVIASTVTGSDEIVTHGHNGLLVEPHNYEMVPRYLEELHRSPALLGHLRRGALETARRQPGWEQQTGRLEAALEQLLREGFGHRGVRQSLSGLSSLRGRYLDEVWARERFGLGGAAPLEQPIGDGEALLLRRYRKLKSSLLVQQTLGRIPPRLGKTVRDLLTRAIR